jgi:hypothetical protein
VLRGAPRPDGSPGDVAYYVDFPGCNTLQVPESALEPPPTAVGDVPAPPPADGPAAQEDAA